MGKRIVVLFAAAMLLAAPVARADGDPASDYLLSRATFIPPELGINAQTRGLETTVRLARRRGYAVRVAVVASAYDLGSVASLIGKPKLYARFLGQELRFVYAGRLLVVMPDGYGFATGGEPGPSEQSVLDRLPAPGRNATTLLQGAVTAVRALARSHGVTVPVPVAAAEAPAAAPKGGGMLWGLVGGLIAAALALGAGGLVLSRRKGHPSGDD